MASDRATEAIDGAIDLLQGPGLDGDDAIADVRERLVARREQLVGEGGESGDGELEKSADPVAFAERLSRAPRGEQTDYLAKQESVWGEGGGYAGLDGRAGLERRRRREGGRAA
jgi:hypothetical protein